LKPEDSGSAEKEDDESPFSHRDALVACRQLAVYAFSQSKRSDDITTLLGHARELLLAGMKQQMITAFFTDSVE
jgi:hypothetical protein